MFENIRCPGIANLLSVSEVQTPVFPSFKSTFEKSVCPSDIAGKEKAISLLGSTIEIVLTEQTNKNELAHWVLRLRTKWASHPSENTGKLGGKCAF